MGVAAALLLTILYFTVGVMSGLRSAANLVVAPFSWTVDQVARPIGHIFAGTINYSDVLAQNQKLRYELGRAQLALNEHLALYRELQQVTTQYWKSWAPPSSSLARYSPPVLTFSRLNGSPSSASCRMMPRPYLTMNCGRISRRHWGSRPKAYFRALMKPRLLQPRWPRCIAHGSQMAPQ